MPPDASTSGYSEEFGLAYWMERVARKCEAAGQDLTPDTVHDLRVALRRCRSIADGYGTFDPDPSWKQMRREGKILFKRLGDLRDVQVMLDWARRLAPGVDAAVPELNPFLAGRELQMKADAREALQKFNLKKWEWWSRELSDRSPQIPYDGPAFQHLALERWHLAHHLHRQALRNRSQISFHRLRIGLKKFRYTVENFLPQRHQQWGRDLRELQDLLGEVHDLYVLWRTALGIGGLRDKKVRAAWRSRIREECGSRLQHYRRKMGGESHLWRAWRSDLPEAGRLKSAAMARLEAWATFRDTDPARSALVTRLALQLYDGLNEEGLIRPVEGLDTRFLLNTAALLHNIGAGEGKRHVKATCRMIEKLKPPLGYEAEDLRLVALIVRYHRGAFPHLSHREFAGLTENLRRAVLLAAGILRLAAVFASAENGSVHSVGAKRIGPAISLIADSYAENDPVIERLAKARYLLERACRAPVMVRSATASTRP